MADVILFYALAALTVITGGLTVTSRNIFHAALWLAVCLLGVAALYVTLGAWFLAAIQVLVYIGAVVVLAIFVINLTRQITGAPVTLARRWAVPAALVAGLTSCLVIVAIMKASAAGGLGTAAGSAPDATSDAAGTLGRQLLGAYVLPFELASVLLLSALVAAIAVVGKDKADET